MREITMEVGNPDNLSLSEAFVYAYIHIANQYSLSNMTLAKALTASVGRNHVANPEIRQRIGQALGMAAEMKGVSTEEFVLGLGNEIDTKAVRAGFVKKRRSSLRHMGLLGLSGD